MKYINSLRQDTSGEDGCGVGSHQVKVQPAINVKLLLLLSTIIIIIILLHLVFLFMLCNVLLLSI